MHLGSAPQPHRRKIAERRPWPTLGVALALFFISLSMVIRAQAMPVEAHITETWYAYKQDLAYDFQANVDTGSIYTTSPMRAKDLLQLRMPTEPATYRRLLVAKLTDTVTFALPYQFHAEQDADIQVTYWIDGTFTVPNLWQRPYPFVEKTVVNVHGKDVNLDQLKVEIPIRKLMTDLQQVTADTKINQEQAEIRVHPVFQVTVNGLREPVKADLAPEITMNIRGSNYAVEVDEPQTFHDEKNYSEHKILPATFDIFGLQVEVNLVRQLGTTFAVIFAAVTAAVVALQWARKKAKASYDVSKLGPYLVQATRFDISATTAIAELDSMKELLQMQVQMERPIVQVGRTYYLADTAVCYTLTVPEEPEPAASASETATVPMTAAVAIAATVEATVPEAPPEPEATVAPEAQAETAATSEVAPDLEATPATEPVASEPAPATHKPEELIEVILEANPEATPEDILEAIMGSTPESEIKGAPDDAEALIEAILDANPEASPEEVIEAILGSDKEGAPATTPEEPEADPDPKKPNE